MFRMTTTSAGQRARGRISAATNRRPPTSQGFRRPFVGNSRRGPDKRLACFAAESGLWTLTRSSRQLVIIRQRGEYVGSGSDHPGPAFFEDRLDLLRNEFSERGLMMPPLFQDADRVLPLDAAEVGLVHEIAEQPLQLFRQ